MTEQNLTRAASLSGEKGVGRKRKSRKALKYAIAIALALHMLGLDGGLSFHGDFGGASSAFAGNGKANGNAGGNGKGNGNAAENGNSNAGGNDNAGGNGKAGGNGNGNAGGNGNGVANGITDGNGVGFDLGDGLGLGVGIGGGDTIGVGIGIAVGDQPRRAHDNLEPEKEKRNASPSETAGGPVSSGRGPDTHGKNALHDLDLGKHFRADQIKRELGNTVEEFSKMLDANWTGNVTATGDRAVGNGDERATAADKHPAKADINARPADTEKAAKSNGIALGHTKEKENGNNGRALGHTKENGNGKGKALAKGKDKDTDKDVAVEGNAAGVASRDDQSSGSSVPLRPGSYIDREVLALGLNSAGISRARQLGFEVSETELEQDEKALITLSTPRGLNALDGMALLRRELPRESFHLNWIYRPYNTSTKDDIDGTPESVPDAGRTCRADKCYARAVMGWKDKLADCARDINVGVIDTDVDLRHPAFSGRKITARTFLAEGRQSSPTWHGTGVLALLAGSPESETPGLIPEARFFVANIFFTDGNGEVITDTLSLLKSLEWMSASQARVINMSFSGPEDELVQVRLKALRRRGFMFTAAAGNDGPAALPNYPAAYPEVVAVTAVNRDRHVYPSANRGPYIDLAAPGVRIWTAQPDAGGGYRTGTSFATPFATAVLSLQRQDLTYEQKDELLDRLNVVKLGTQAHDPIFGRGLLQAPGECSAGTAPISRLGPATGTVAR